MSARPGAPDPPLPALGPPARSLAEPRPVRTRPPARSVAAENRQVPQGPCGVAFLGDVSMGAYTLLLYKSQENHLARVPFTDQFKLETTVSRALASQIQAQRFHSTRLGAPACVALF